MRIVKIDKEIPIKTLLEVSGYIPHKNGGYVNYFRGIGNELFRFHVYIKDNSFEIHTDKTVEGLHKAVDLFLRKEINRIKKHRADAYKLEVLKNE